MDYKCFKGKHANIVIEIISLLEKGVKKAQEILEKPDAGSYTKLENSSGDTPIKADLALDKFLEENFLSLENIKSVFSEEKETPVTKENGSYLIAYDPLDGSSVMEANFLVGTIIGIYEKDYKAQNLAASLYVVFGHKIELVVALEEVYRYSFYQNKFHFIETIVLENKGKIVASGGNQKDFSLGLKKALEGFFAENYRLRYSGSMVADVHHVLVKKGGMFSYPQKKLRKLFEVFPLALMVEKAKGEAFYFDKGVKKRLLEQSVENYHEKSECYLASQHEAHILEKYLKGE
ncbi:class 1 fructose-bisphosphatase [Helicobacter pylori]|jgi:D-fructose 1,6-bisphosphatase (EC 3.1.3.11)|uniref:Fructose-1,6-bisphosphatase class 1 n=2 Tax=Helicobacter pylori TaxID=210 RepID=F16PA_HELPY|nr:class 1 fructose-bisphosphatase [Helicobacter pylori]O25936.1 RecName: Full=Fructose-1,6-bisphosphatase class 1; Short=FBPase class 1; AltName: Full=D-fructose-1,6-bisphosphate 1-phosphohydrolase class 1 [Helicobacter pylori 26695]AAD08424.1 fructose-1,6-bisphosphatase [Helicobacter pylori 26695]AFV42605.1 fructose-1,6-bisphosphatase [Helicobacter pylori 26695]AFV44200.1 fructose-1,6-bisphosphatase [Helicobacter pylori Rif1]AFV45793.1 fructose-1,6-bisphosphatase [Helicobacter pylori Rif2]A